MKLKTLIIDDEPLAHDVILTFAEDTPYLEMVGQCYLATEALQLLREQEVDLIFLDIQMPKLKGLDFLRTLTIKPLVIITSAYEEYAIESFELDVCDYLVKPFRLDRFLKATNKALDLYQLRNPKTKFIQTIAEAKEDEQLFIKSDKKLIQLDPGNIDLLESFGNYVKVWTGQEFLLTLRTLTSFEEQLDSNQFIRIHKSFIINKSSVNYLEGNTILLKSEKSLTIGKNYRQSVKIALGGS